MPMLCTYNYGLFQHGPHKMLVNLLSLNFYHGNCTQSKGECSVKKKLQKLKCQQQNPNNKFVMLHEVEM